MLAGAPLALAGRLDARAVDQGMRGAGARAVRGSRRSGPIERRRKAARSPAPARHWPGTGPALARHWPVQARQRHEARDQPPLPPGSSRWRLDGSICRTGSPNQRPSRIGQVWIAASRTGHGAAAVAPGDRPPLHPRVTPDQPRAAPPQGRVAGPPVGRAVGRQGQACSLGNLGLTRVRPVGWSGVGPAPPSRLPGSRGPSRARMRPAGRDGGRESETGHRTRRHGWPP